MLTSSSHFKKSIVVPVVPLLFLAYMFRCINI
uniref:Uncharacterized protein n=1 Tax=Anguilla anguilla TaxID=7936 RepID=A0A0E9T5F9_ANGAN